MNIKSYFLLTSLCIRLFANAQANYVELLSFNATGQAGGVNISWATGSETNVDYFSIERSVDAINYITVGAVIGSGNSTSVISYNFADNGPFTSKCFYYRLKTVYLNDSAQYFAAIYGCYNDVPDIKAFNKPYPNPSSGNIQIAFNDIDFAPEINIYFFELSGKMVAHRVLDGSNANGAILYIEVVNTPALGNGVYLLVIYNGDKKIYSGKLILL